MTASTKRSLLILALFAFIAIANADVSDSAQQNYNLFKDWFTQHGKQYGVDETPIRYSAWKNNYDAIQEHNAKNLSWTLGLNQFSDLSPEEFSALHLGFKMPASSSSSSSSSSLFPNFPNIPGFPNIPNFPNFPNWPIVPNNNGNGTNPSNHNSSNGTIPSNNNSNSSNGTIPSNNNSNSSNGTTPSNSSSGGGSGSSVTDMLLAVPLNTTLDWRNNNVVTPIKNQGSCGACWAFSSTGALEALYAINKSQLLSFSEQQLIDCTTSSTYGNDGCNGGLMVPTFQYTASNGIELESDYPFTGKDGTCQYSSSKVAFKNNGVLQVPVNNATLLKHAANLQPVSVAIEADQTTFQNYQSGIISSNCGTNLDHAVLVVGYDSSNGVDYWIVKNQWGTSWGLNGYVYIASGDQNSGAGVCGINSQPAFPTL